MRVVGLDLSLRSTGVACECAGEDGTLALHTGLLGETRLAFVRDQVMAHVLGTSPEQRHKWESAGLVVIEGYSFSSRDSHAHALGELGGVVRVALYEAGIPFVVIAPAKVKKYACGAGNAKKEQVLGAAVHRAKREFATTDEADAWWLRQMGCAHLELPHIAMPAAHRVALEGIDWPVHRLSGANA